MTEQGMTYTVTSPHGQVDFLYADTMWEAYTEALEIYGEGVIIRPSFYGEWKCGTEGKGSCYYDKFGVHNNKHIETGGHPPSQEVTND